MKMTSQKRKYRLHNALILGAILACTVILWLLRVRELPPTVPPNAQKADLAQWVSLPGAKKANQGIAIQPIQRHIVNQDGSQGVADPAVAIDAQHVRFWGDFTITTEIDRTKLSEVAWRYYASPPDIYDEWRGENPSVAFVISSDVLKIQFWDGSDSEPETLGNYTITRSNEMTIATVRKGDLLTVWINGARIAKLDIGEVFSNGSLWFGASAAKASWTLKNIVVSSDAKFEGPVSTPRKSKSRAKPLFGVAVSVNPLLSNPTYQQIVTQNFGIWTTENSLKPQFVHPEKQTFTFGETDAVIKTAKSHDIAIHGHALVFGEANPRWMTEASPSEKKQILTNHVQTIVSHYRGEVASWDVINEPLSDEDADYANGRQGLRHHIWLKDLGEEYIPQALQAARSADPAAKLYINDYGLEADGRRWQALLSLITRLQNSGTPLDGIGFQAHVYTKEDAIDPVVLARHFSTLRSKGLDVRISEIDVTGDDSLFQMQQYTRVMQTCLSAPNCTSFTTWGVSDKYGSTTEIQSYPRVYGNDLLWDKELQPKPLVKPLMDILNSH